MFKNIEQAKWIENCMQKAEVQIIFCLLQDKECAGKTIREIAERAGVSIGSVHSTLVTVLVTVLVMVLVSPLSPLQADRIAAEPTVAPPMTNPASFRKSRRERDGVDSRGVLLVSFIYIQNLLNLFDGH